MPIITLPDSTELEFPDNPTSEDKAFLKKLIAKFEGQNDPTKKFDRDFKPKSNPQDKTGFEQTKTNNNVLDSLKLGWNEVQKQGQRGLDLFEGGIASLLGNTEDVSAIEARAQARNAQINEMLIHINIQKNKGLDVVLGASVTLLCRIFQ